MYFTGQPRQVVGKRVPAVEKRVETVTSRKDNSDNSDDEDDDNDMDDIDYDVVDDGGGSYSEDEHSDSRDVACSMVESLNDSKQAAAKKTTCYTQKGDSTKRDACVSASTSKSKRRAVDCASEKNTEAHRTSRVCGMQSTLPSPESDRKSQSADNRALSSLAGNLVTCQVKIQKLPICSKHGRNMKVVYKSGHQMSKRPLHGDVMSNRDSKGNGEHRKEKERDSTVPQKEVHTPTIKSQKIQKTKNTRTEDNYTEIQGELLSDKRRKLVDSSSGTVKKHLGSKNGISNRTLRRAKMQKTRYVQTSEERSSSEEHDNHSEVLTENRDNSNGVNRGLGQSRQPLIEDAITKNDSDNDGDNDEDDEESVKITPIKDSNRLTVAEVYDDEEDDEISNLERETAMSELDVQRGVGYKEKGEISRKGKEILTRGTNSIEETPQSRTQNIDKQFEKQVSSIEKDMGGPQKERRSPKKDLLSKKILSPSKSKGALESSKQKTDDTFGHETGDNSGERQLCRAMNETSRLHTVPMKDKSPSERPVNSELSKEKYSAVGVDEASGIAVEENRKSVIDSNAESAGNRNDHASEDETCQEEEPDEVSQRDGDTKGKF